jgi:hypothetical protein
MNFNFFQYLQPVRSSFSSALFNSSQHTTTKWSDNTFKLLRETACKSPGQKTSLCTSTELKDGDGIPLLPALLLIGLTHIFFDKNQFSGSQDGLQKRVFEYRTLKSVFEDV